MIGLQYIATLKVSRMFELGQFETFSSLSIDDRFTPENGLSATFGRVASSDRLNITHKSTFAVVSIVVQSF